MTGRLLVAAAFLVGIQLTFAAVPDARAEDEASIRLAFTEAAFGPTDRTGASLFRWQGDVTVRFTGQAAGRHRSWADDQLTELRLLTGIELRRIDSIGADILVVFTDSFSDVVDGKYNELLDRFVAGEVRREALLEGFRRSGAICAGQVVARGNMLTGGIVFIPRDQLSPVVRACISAQFMRVMGLPFPIGGEARSVLTTNSPFSHLTDVDRVLLKLLYHPRMRAGLGRTDAAIIVRSILPQLTGTSD